MTVSPGTSDVPSTGARAVGSSVRPLPEVFDRYRDDAATLFDASTLNPVGDMPAGHHDEMLDPSGSVRAAWADFVEGYGERGDGRLRAAAARLSAAVRDDGVVYNHVDGGRTVTREWQIDPVPLVVDGGEWASLEKSITQRSLLLDKILRDIYRDQKTITSGLIPPEMVFGHPGYIRKAARLEVAGPHALFLHALDLGRRRDGAFAVWADRTQAPSGIGFSMVDRRLVSRTFPQLFQSCAPRPMTTFAASLRLALFDYAPPGVEDPTVAVLTPGSLSETAFDQAYLASALGFPLVEGGDLTVRDGGVYMRSLGRYKRVDVLLRRVDAEYVDPLDLRTDSRLGVAGLVEAISRGTVTVVNTLGSGVLENPALHTVLERVAPMLIDEELTLPSVPTYWAGDDLQRSKICADIDSMVLTNFRTDEEIIGAFLDRSARADLAARIEAQGWPWVGRTLAPYSVAPSMTPGAFPLRSDRVVRAAPVAVRAFSLAQGPTYTVMPGGLGSVLADGISGGAMVSVAAKDVWVTSAEVGGHVSRKSESRGDLPEEVVPVAGDRVGAGAFRVASGYSDVAAVGSPRVLSDLYWLGRYAERTEFVTRLAMVARERYQDVQYRPWAAGFGAVPQLLHATATITGTAAHLGTVALLEPDADDTVPAPSRVIEAIAKIAGLTIDTVPGTIAYSVDRLIGSVRAVRDQMSTSTWMVLAPVERAVERLTEELGTGEPGARVGVSTLDLGPDLSRAHHDILHGVLAFTGLQAESMVHDPGWRFMDLGRRVERTATLADLTATLFVDARSTDIEQSLFESYLVANESSIIYRRRNRGMFELTAIAELLLFDETNPRSLIYQLDRMRDDLSAVPDAVRSAGAERIVEELIAEMRRADPADLAHVDDDGRRGELADLMVAIRDGVRDLSDQLVRTRFAAPRQAQPIWGATGGDVLP